MAGDAEREGRMEIRQRECEGWGGGGERGEGTFYQFTHVSLASRARKILLFNLFFSSARPARSV